MASSTSTIASMARCLANGSPKNLSKPSIVKATSKNLTTTEIPKLSASSVAGTAFAGAFFSHLSSCDSALAAQQIAQIAEGDNRGIALLLPLVPAIAWVLFNILQPAINQINRMRGTRGVIAGLGLGGLAASGFAGTPHAEAVSEMAAVGEAASGDNRGQLLLFVVAPALLWVLYNILQPALNQINKMRR